MATQVVTPNPDIPCKPGWCLQFVNDAFDAGNKPGYVWVGSATAGWEQSPTKHEDWNFPSGVWFPVWFHLDKNENGHVALVAPDGTVYSTSDLTNTPHHHSSVSDLMGYYAYYGMTLTYLGWTEDVQGVRVISLGDDDMTPEQFAVLKELRDRMMFVFSEPNDKALTTAHIPKIAARTWDEPITLPNGKPSTPRTKMVYEKQEFDVLQNMLTAQQAQIQALAGVIATGSAATKEEVLAQIDKSLQDTLGSYKPTFEHVPVPESPESSAAA